MDEEEENRRQVWGSLVADLESKYDNDDDDDDDEEEPTQRHNLFGCNRGTKPDEEPKGHLKRGLDENSYVPIENGALIHEKTLDKIGGYEPEPIQNAISSQDVDASLCGNYLIEPTPTAYQDTLMEKPGKTHGITDENEFSPILHISQINYLNHNLVGENNDQIQMKPSPLRGWILWSIGRSGEKRSREYIEKAVCVAFSLAKRVIELSKTNPNKLMDEEKIEIDNMVLTHKTYLDVDFVACPIKDDEGRATETSTIANNRNQSIRALGKVFFHLFYGEPLQLEGHLDQLVTSATELSFNAALRISNDDSESSLSRPNALIGQKLRKILGGSEKKRDARTNLQQAGVPISVCRLVADMLASGSDSSDLFARDQPISCMSDVMSDLAQMIENPRSYLHDSLRMKTTPEFGDELYGRDTELKIAIAAADRVSLLISSKNSSFLGISGEAGLGKSHLALELGSMLEKKGWSILHCKFEKGVHPKPLSTITASFDRFFARMAASTANELRDQIVTTIDDETIGILCELIPRMKDIVPAKSSLIREGNSSLYLNACDAVNIKCRLYHIFSLLARAISMKNPLMFWIDDMQWADAASIDLIHALMEGGEDIRGACSFVLFVGTYRSDVEESSILAKALERIKESEDISVDEIKLTPISKDCANQMISQCLCFPRRLTRNLADLCHIKAAGNPFYIRHFVMDLHACKILRYDLSSRQWEWSEDEIETRAMPNGVAKLLARKLHLLPKDVLSSLRVMSSFGSRVSFKLLNHVKHACGNEDIISSLTAAAEIGLVKKRNDSFAFIHDIVMETVRDGIDEDDRVVMLKELVDTLLEAIPQEERDDATIFLLVDLINRAHRQAYSPSSTTCDTPGIDKRDQFAKLNLKAATIAMQIPDFPSATVYLSAGVSFLPDDHWESTYNMSLSFFNNATIAHWAVGETELTHQKIDTVLKYAASFDDKLTAMNVLVQATAMDGSSITKSFEHGFAALKHLGEEFPSLPDFEVVVEELKSIKKLLREFLPSSPRNFSEMKDPRKIQAMNFLRDMLHHSYQLKSRFLPLIASRMTKLSIKYGLSTYSALGFASTAFAFVSILHDFDGGYNLAKYSRLMVESSCPTHSSGIVSDNVLPEVYSVVFGLVNIWREPVQAVLPPLLESYRRALQAGKTSTALVSASLYAYRAFFSGSNLNTISKESNIFLRQMAIYKRTGLYMLSTPISNAVTHLIGGPPMTHRNDALAFFDNDDNNLDNAFNNELHNVAESIVVAKLMRSIIFRDFDEAERIAGKYLRVFEDYEDAGMSQFINIYRNFYGGLIAFHCLRKTGEQFWMDRGSRAIKKMKIWTRECQWSFENKLLLLQAEEAFSLGEVNLASELYAKAITSGQRHRFVHEEAVSCEFASAFFEVLGKMEESLKLLQRAKRCYQAWGALKKAQEVLADTSSSS